MWPAIHFRGGARVLDGSRAWVMGVLNVTPDSFSDGGSFLDEAAAIVRVRTMIAEGADVIDVGGESTRPGAEPVGVEEEWGRVAPVLAAMAGTSAAPISIDTYKAVVAERALRAGAEIVNDVSGGAMEPAILDVAAAHDAVFVASHLRGEPRTMQAEMAFVDVFEEVAAELAARVAAARARGVRRIIADPGIGFGKTVGQNLVLLARAGELSERLGLPVLVGPSRKGFLGALTGTPPEGRGAATLGAVVASVLAGAAMVRVHDVAPTRQALVVAQAVGAAGAEGRPAG